MKKNPPSRALRFALGRTILNENESFFLLFFFLPIVRVAC